MLRAGDVLARRYRLRERVGGGGMGDVWSSEDTVLGRIVAVKVLRGVLADETKFRERFRREARAIASLQDDGIVDVYDYGETTVAGTELAFLVMQFVEGESLSRHLAGQERLTTGETLQIVAQVADALQAAHNVGIVHRDVKPGNILLRGDGRTMLVDFGIARTWADHTMTSIGVVLGTVSYMSPEQAAGEKLGPAADIYSLGVVAHQCLSGRPPYRAKTPLAMLAAHLNNDVPPRLPDDVPSPVAALIGRAMERDPRDRWSSAAAFASGCRRVLRTPVPARRMARGSAPVPRWGVPTIPVTRPGRAPVATRTGRPSPVPGPPRPAGRPGGPKTGPAGESATGPTGSNGPTGGSASASEVDSPRTVRSRRRVVLIGILMVLLALVTAAFITEPWDIAGFAPGLPSGDRPGGGAGPVPGSVPPGAPINDQSGQSHADPGSGSPATDVDDVPSRPEGSAPHEPTSPAQTPSTAPDQRVSVPDVVTFREAEARAVLERAELKPSVDYSGDGATGCTVTGQEPSGGTEADPGSTVTITVVRADVCTS